MKAAERDAWMITKATVIMLRGERLSAQDMAGMLLAAHADGRLDNFISKRIAPMILYVNRTARSTCTSAASDVVVGRSDQLLATPLHGSCCRDQFTDLG